MLIRFHRTQRKHDGIVMTQEERLEAIKLMVIISDIAEQYHGLKPNINFTELARAWPKLRDRELIIIEKGA